MANCECHNQMVILKYLGAGSIFFGAGGPHISAIFRVFYHPIIGVLNFDSHIYTVYTYIIYVCIAYSQYNNTTNCWVTWVDPTLNPILQNRYFIFGGRVLNTGIRKGIPLSKLFRMRQSLWLWLWDINYQLSWWVEQGTRFLTLSRSMGYPIMVNIVDFPMKNGDFP